MYGRDADENYEYEEEAAPGLVVPTSTIRKSRGRDRQGRETQRETTVLKLRACMRCRLVMTEEQFMENGCLNCPELEMDNSSYAISRNTTDKFKGLVVILKPESSWVAKFNELSDVVPGTYAVSIGDSVQWSGNQ